MNETGRALHDAAGTRALLPLPDLMREIARAAEDLAAGRLCAPARQAVPFPGGAVMLSMPATAADVGIHKLVNVAPGNRAHGLPTINGLVSVHDGETGRLRLLLDGPAVTTRRTAAVSMLAASRLLPGGPRHAAVFGTGVQAAGHVQALLELHPDARVDVIGHAPGRAEAFARTFGTDRVRPARGVDPAADLVITATTSAVPVYDRPARAGRLVIGVGAYRPDLAEIGARTLADSHLFVDDPEGARHEAGDYLQAGVDWLRVRSLAGLLAAGPPEGAAVFKSVGCAAWDLAAARCALRFAHSSERNLS
ncbi:delta(1)-pyrroline-2-carboxylate reductase family protein [Castellaniella defragrans]|uniref:1-piperideine-2-carboxylate/1-pyrroline-2-carboxylate reductase [NAD(P)H] n=1 Tax=Castellaniella defragrans TaxID=75697 RepID=A0A7W9TNJ3_CASDE|nr:delta(1)-pyrroline-2-carboxylate reductase family protein [Castellaniella defragrans]KAB0616307.1 delta(1)-pyrroline-2-carboxylate reductase family protein [Castellaniella defragrans]MBB6083819.1 1-piperideine-2-carboxylate/1-pyrroline-2-carboxylate reductase [NAD(P)H] [Castellaniella defragrans]